MQHRTATLLIAGIGVLAALLVAAVTSVPYVTLLPGPTLNTLGKQGAKPLIQIVGKKTYPTTGHLNMVTISYIGGPHTDYNIFAALRAWLTPHYAVVPQQVVFPTGSTQQQVVQQDTEEMTGSQQDATAAALCQLNIPYKTVDTVQATLPGKPASGVLKPGDQITAVNGKQVNCHNDLVSMIRATKPGSMVTLTVVRHGHTMKIKLKTVDVEGNSVVGVELAPTGFVFPFSVKFNISKIGGPSAGLMFALGIIDKLTTDNLTDGRFIAGTGEIEPNGSVQPIGGIQQKMVGARSAGATIFLTPASNCSDTVGAVPPGLRLVKVSTLAGAIRDLNAIKQGQSVPSC
jgi:PDZ domain-containing protein